MNLQLALSAPNYQLRVPWYHQLIPLAGVLSVCGAILLVREDQALLAALLVTLAGVAGLHGGLLLLLLNRRGRERARQQMIASIDWRGTEQILDVGCGNGLVMLAAARHLIPGKGKALGIDVWDPRAGRQDAASLWKNAELEGVSDRIGLQEADARHIPFADATFDVVFASLSLHHVGTRPQRRKAVTEMMRVLKPGGTILVYDLLPIARQAAGTLRELGASEMERVGGLLVQTFRVRKP